MIRTPFNKATIPARLASSCTLAITLTVAAPSFAIDSNEAPHGPKISATDGSDITTPGTILIVKGTTSGPTVTASGTGRMRFTGPVDIRLKGEANANDATVLAAGGSIVFADTLKIGGGESGTLLHATGAPNASGTATGAIELARGGQIVGALKDGESLIRADHGGTIDLTGAFVSAELNSHVTGAGTKLHALEIGEGGGNIVLNWTKVNAQNLKGHAAALHIDDGVGATQAAPTSGYVTSNVTMYRSQLATTSYDATVIEVAKGTSFARININSRSRLQPWEGAKGMLLDTSSNTEFNVSESVVKGAVLSRAENLRISLAKSEWSGNLATQGAGSADVALHQYSRWTGRADRVDRVRLTSDSALWTLTGNSNVRYTIENHGKIDLTRANGRVTLETGHYSGTGAILMNTYLNGGSSSSDRLAYTGSARGRTTLHIAATGPGGLTSGDGVAVVHAVDDDARSDAGAFVLAGGILNVGAFSYELHHGGPTRLSTVANSWYLRSTKTITPPTPPTPQPARKHSAPQSTPHHGNDLQRVTSRPNLDKPAYDRPAPVAADTSPAIPMITRADGSVEVPMYRAETALYAAIPDLARTLSLATAGSRNDRHGSGVLRPVPGGKATWAGAWARAFGGRMTDGASQSLTPSVDGHYAGLQIGADLLGYANSMGEGRFGLFGGYASAYANVRGFVRGVMNAPAGSLDVNATSAGMYWTHTGARGWYVDATLTGSYYNSGGRSLNGLSPKTDGSGVTLSVEAGLPIAIGGGFILEPQAQAVYRTLSLDNAADRFSSMRFDLHNGARLRAGARLSHDFTVNDARVQPWLQASYWKETSALDSTLYNGVTRIASGSPTAGVDVDAGAELALASGMAIWGSGGVTVDIARPEGRADRRVWRAKAGLHYQW